MAQPTLNQENTASHLVLNSSVELPCGSTLKNRLAKSAMSDSLGDGAGDSTSPWHNKRRSLMATTRLRIFR